MVKMFAKQWSERMIMVRELTIHSCLRDLRNETSLEYIANGIGQCINFRNLTSTPWNESGMFHLLKTCCTWKSYVWINVKTSVMTVHYKVFRATLTLRNCQWTFAFSWSHVSCSSCVSVQKNLIIFRQRDVLKCKLRLAERCLNTAI